MMIPTENVRALRGRPALVALASFLDDLKPGLYEHVFWTNPIFEEWYDTDTDKAPSCGTQACAAGWSAYLFDAITLDRWGRPRLGARRVPGEIGSVINDMAHFFDLSPSAAEFIFGARGDHDRRSARQTAERIRTVIGRSDVTI